MPGFLPPSHRRKTVTGTCRGPLFCGRPHTIGGHQPSSIAFALRAPRALTWGIQMMKFPRRRFLHLATGAAALPAVSRVAWPQTYPSRPVRIIVPFPAGQATDSIARLMGQSLSERLGQAFVVENRTGAGGNIGTEAVVRAPPDGYTLLLAGLSSATNATLYKKLNFDFIQDIAPVASIAGGPYVMVINPSVPAKTVPEFIVYAKANPGKINMASSGNDPYPMSSANYSR